MFGMSVGVSVKFSNLFEMVVKFHLGQLIYKF